LDIVLGAHTLVLSRYILEEVERVLLYLVKAVELPDGVQPDQLSSEEIQNLLRPIV
jgi:hypothetical protein